MKNLFLITLLVLSFGVFSQAPVVPKTGNLTLTRGDIKTFLQAVKQDMVSDTVDTAENMAFKKTLEDALKTSFSSRTINGVPARFVRRLVNQSSYYVQQFEMSRKEVTRVNNILVEWKSTGDTALRVLDGDNSPLFEKEKIKVMVRKGKMTN